MVGIAGVKTERDSRGNLVSITINLKKQPEALPLLKSIGLVEKSEAEKYIESETWVSVEEARDRLLKVVHTNYASSNNYRTY